MTWAFTEKGCSRRRACALVGIDPPAWRCRSTRGDDRPLRTRLRGLSAARRGRPCWIGTDSGTEPTSNAIPRWQEGRAAEWHDIASGKPMWSGQVESFTSRLGDGFLNEPPFPSLRHARHLIAAWCEDHNRHSPHSSPGGLTPRKFHQRPEKDPDRNRPIPD